MARVIHQLSYAIPDRRRRDATLRQGQSRSAGGQGVGILELVGSQWHHQLRHTLGGGGEHCAAPSVVQGEIDLGQHQILTDEALHPDRIGEWTKLVRIEIGSDGNQNIHRELGQSSQGVAHQVNCPPADRAQR